MKETLLPVSSNTSDTSLNTSDTICAYPLAINHIKFGPQLTLQEGSYHHSLMEEKHMPDIHPSSSVIGELLSIETRFQS